MQIFRRITLLLITEERHRIATLSKRQGRIFSLVEIVLIIPSATELNVLIIVVEGNHLLRHVTIQKTVT
jgi:hypothetical protein